ncbi:MAG: cytochrome P450 [Prochlorococcaceae cyanobacterium]
MTTIWPKQLLLLLFAGYETTASSLSCLFRALLLHPEVMEWLSSDVMASPWPAATSPQSEKTRCHGAGGDAANTTSRRILPPQQAGH